jgi:hypothetical protein
MNKTLITPRAFFIVGLLVVCFLLGYASHAAEPKAKKRSGERPFSMLVLTQCGHYVTLYVTWNDGHIVGYDVRGQSDEDVNEFILTTTGTIAELAANCNKVGVDSK